MNPAFSVVFFTTIAGAAQGLVVGIALLAVAGPPVAASFATTILMLATLMLVIGLGASFAHLGRPERAWRAAAMWRTSWLSREVIALPAFIVVVASWSLAVRGNLGAMAVSPVWPAVAVVLAGLLWYCTAKIYACLRFIEEWAHPLTLVNFVLLGLSSGLVLLSAMSSLGGEPALSAFVAPMALAATLAAWLARTASLRRNRGLRHRSTLHTATGIPGSPLKQKSMGMSAGSFNTREFFHHASAAAVRSVRWAAHGLGFALPSLLLLASVVLGRGESAILTLAVASQAIGLVADRWLFFAEAKHPQNLYYQVVS